MGLLDNKVIVITGATSGIGAATAIECADAGAKGVIVAGRREKEGTEVAEFINSRYGAGRASFVWCDVNDESTVEALFVTAAARYGRVDGVFNNAGRGSPHKSVEDTTREELEAVYHTNTGGAFVVLKHAIKFFKKQGPPPNTRASAEKASFTRKNISDEYRARTKALADPTPGYSIVNCSSLATQTASGAPAYKASKHAVDGLTKIAAKENARSNIRVNSVHPGIIDTSIWSNVDAMVEAGAGTPMGRVGLPSEIARPVVFLLSDWASYMTGAQVLIDGGAPL